MLGEELLREFVKAVSR